MNYYLIPADKVEEIKNPYPDPLSYPYRDWKLGKQSILSLAKRVDLDELLKQWISLPENWRTEWGESGGIDIFTYKAMPFSQYLESLGTQKEQPK